MNLDKYELAIFKKRLNQESSYLLGYEDFLKTGICILLLWQEDEYHLYFRKEQCIFLKEEKFVFLEEKGSNDVDFWILFLEKRRRNGILQSKLEVIGPFRAL